MELFQARTRLFLKTLFLSRAAVSNYEDICVWQVLQYYSYQNWRQTSPKWTLSKELWGRYFPLQYFNGQYTLWPDVGHTELTG